jgi:PAS domain S-box-containing protein
MSNVTHAGRSIAVSLSLAQAIGRTRTVDEIFSSALDAIALGLDVTRASILLFDPDGVMRFKAHRGLSAAYRRAVEGHTPWTPETSDPEPIVVSDVAADPSLAPFLETIVAEGIAAMTFIPLVSLHRVIGKFMLYYDRPHATSVGELQLASVIAAQVAFAVERTRTEEQARRSENRLRFALDAASMGTWDWDLTSNAVEWSDNLERLHGLPPGSFDRSFASYEREIHPDDRARVVAAAQRAIAEGTPYEVEYRLVAPDGSIRWCEGKGVVEYVDGRAVRMSGVCMMTTRRKQAELARLAAAEEASRLKDEFLATLSHELRTPLNAILGWVQMLQGSTLSDDRLAQAIDVIDRNARLQTKLIEDILDVSRIITGKLHIDRGPVSVAPLIDTVVTGIAPAAEAKDIQLIVNVADPLPPIDGDLKRLHQVFGNVLSNAVKFTPEGGRIELRCDIRGSCLVVEVADTGVGIPPDFLPHVFDRFRQADSRFTRRHGGLGLGLAIARHLVEQHGGEIAAASAGTGQGTTVTIRLPIGLPLAAGVPRVSDMRRTVPDDLRLDGVTVLVVDDQRDARELLASLLAQRGATVVESDSAEAALAALASAPVRLLVADIAMPDVDGFQLIRRVRAMGTATAAIAVTAHARPEDRDQAIQSGYSAYCVKPIDRSEFLYTVGALLRTP